MRTSRSLILFTAVAGVTTLFVAACGEQDTPCNSDTDCTAGQACVDKICVATTTQDGGRVRCTPNTVCRVAAGPCDLTEMCGADGFCPDDKMVVDVVCRAPVGPCDFEERCDGIHAQCPADQLAGPSTTCRSSAGGCDIAETCTGDNPQCPPDQLAPSGTVCRAKAGDCDVEEVCAGGTALCPDDVLVAKDTECRASAGDCDPAEKCSGTAAACPADAKEPATKECRAPVNACDVAERCDGASNDCPQDQFAAANTPCAMASCSNGVATAAGFCAGGQAFCDTGMPLSCNGFQCNGPTCGTSCSTGTDCLPTHYCQPGANLCAPKKPDGQPCSSGATGYECTSGTCLATYADTDGDGFGAGPVVYFCGNAAPAGRSAVNTDCCDFDGNAKPGQTGYFTSPRNGCGGFDYDCNGTQSPQYVGTSSCESVGTCSDGDRACSNVGSTGWASSAPACGNTSTYVTDCSSVSACNQWTCSNCSICDITSEPRTQACR